MVGASTFAQVAYLTIILVVWFGSGVITALKGRLALCVVGLLTVGLVWLIGALLPARPGSWWSRHQSGRGL
jgi:hypothetical protein